MHAEAKSSIPSENLNSKHERGKQDVNDNMSETPRCIARAIMRITGLIERQEVSCQWVKTSPWACGQALAMFMGAGSKRSARTLAAHASGLFIVPAVSLQESVEQQVLPRARVTC